MVGNGKGDSGKTYFYEGLNDEDSFRKIIALSSDYYWEQDADHRFTLIRHRNEEKEKALAEALIGKTWWELGGLPELGGESVEGQFDPQLSYKTFHDLIVHYLPPGRRERYFSISGQPLFGNGGEFLGYRGLTRDVTEQKIQERLLHLEREISRILLDAEKVTEGLREAIQAICLSEGWDAGQYWHLDIDQTVMSYFTGWNIDSEGVRKIVDIARQFEFEKGSDLVGAVWESGETLWISDLSKEKRLRTEELAALTGWRQGLLFPITSGGEVAGVLSFYAAWIHEPDERLLNLFQVLGRLIGNYHHRLGALQRIEESQERFHSTVELAAIGISHVKDSVFIHANRQLCDMLGYTEEELLGLSVKDISHPEDVNVTDLVSEKLATGEISSFKKVKRYLHKDGSPIWVQLTVAQKRSQMGKPLYRISVVEDVSERVAMEEALRESQERYHSTVELAAIGIAHVDINGRFIHVNPRFCDMLGYTADELLAQGVKEISHPEDANLTDSNRDKLRNREIDFFTIEKRYLHKNGSVVWVSLTVTSKWDKQGNSLYDISIIEDISARVAAEQRVQYLATHDEMTDLPNRALFLQLLSQAVETNKRHNRNFALIFIDLDSFKQVNDSLGHEAGDLLLIEMASRFKKCLRSSDMVARLGGDEFVVLVQEISRESQVVPVAKNLLSAAISPVPIKGQECRVTASLGICMFPDGARNEQLLMKNADMAMYQAKGEGKNNFQFYSRDMASQVIEKMTLENHLRHAMQNQEFEVQYQAKVNIRTGAVAGVEALLRWNNPELGTVSPAHFIPIAEEIGLIIPLGYWVLKTACEQCIAWQKQGLPTITVSVNISPRQFADPDLCNQIREILESTGLPPQLLELEMTESMIMHKAAEAIQTISELKTLGLRISIDDFGKGYSTLSQLKQFPIDTLKVDRSFIRSLPDDLGDRSITEAIITMGKTLGLTVIAVGVETEAQQEFLRTHACDELQGYYFSKAIPGDKVVELVQSKS